MNTTNTTNTMNTTQSETDKTIASQPAPEAEVAPESKSTLRVQARDAAQTLQWALAQLYEVQCEADATAGHRIETLEARLLWQLRRQAQGIGEWMQAWLDKHPETFPPRYQHDCAQCVYLGGYEQPLPDDEAAGALSSSEETEHYDLYFCRQDGIAPTVLARYGDEGAAYLSGLPKGRRVLQPDTAHPLAEALRRAIHRELLAWREVVAQ